MQFITEAEGSSRSAHILWPLQKPTTCHEVLAPSTLHMNRFSHTLSGHYFPFLGGISKDLFIPVGHRRGKNDIFPTDFVRTRSHCGVVSPLLQGQANEAFPVLQGDRIHAGGRVQGLRCSSDNNDHSISCSVTRQQVVNGVPVHWADTYKRKETDT